MTKPLAVRKLADRSIGERVVRYDPVTGEKKLVNPATPGDQHEPWPLLGVRIEGELPDETRVSTRWVAGGVAEGWLELVNEQVVHRPSGPPDDLWRTPPHTFRQADAIIIKTVDGPVTYRVIHQPDKYVDDAKPDARVTPEIYAAGQTRVDHFYDLELED